MSKEMPNVESLSLASGSGNNTPASTRSRTNSKAPSLNGTPATATGTVRTPFSHALPTSKPSARPDLTTDQSSKYTQLLSLVTAWPSLPKSTTDKTAAPLTDSERMWLTRECLLRYLRATSWHVSASEKRLQETLIWRREYGVEALTAEHISPENETGKQVILGYDNAARPCLYLNPGKQNTKKSERQIQHLVFMLERVIDMMEPGQETSALLINFKGATSGGSPSVAQGRQVMSILQGHYPERLGRACIADLPWFINAFFKLISPFIDPVTREKMIFNDDLRKHVPPPQLQKEYGGDADFKYDHGVYWPALNKMCEERREAYRERWVNGGKRIGEYEAYLKGGEHVGLAALEGGKAAGELAEGDKQGNGSAP